MMFLNHSIKCKLCMKYLIIILFFICSFVSFSQVNGFFGKKNFIDFSIDFHSPLLYNFYNQTSGDTQGYMIKNGTLVQRLPLLNHAFHSTFSRVLTSNFAIGVGGGVSFFSVAPNFDFSSQYSNRILEVLDIRKLTIMPKFEIAYDDAILPMGVSNQFGFGFNYFSVLDKDYSGSVVSNDSYSSDIINVTKHNYYDFNNQKTIKGYSIMYKLTMRIPLNKSLLYHFGFKYTFNFVPSYNADLLNISEPQTLIDDNFILKLDDMKYMIKTKENRSLLLFETGLTYSF